MLHSLICCGSQMAEQLNFFPQQGLRLMELRFGSANGNIQLRGYVLMTKTIDDKQVEDRPVAVGK